MKDFKILVFATKGSGTNEEKRIIQLLHNFEIYLVAFEPKQKFRSYLEILRQARETKPSLIVMEGTGIFGGLACIWLRIFKGIPYILSSGDAIAPFLSLNYPFLYPFTISYEAILYRLCYGFIGWTPYLVGRALTFGATKGLTAAGWVHFERSPKELEASRQAIRIELGIPEDAIVFGLLGAIIWNPKVNYCYGYELVQALAKIQRQDIYVLIVGDGSGLDILKKLAGSNLNNRIFLTGNVPLEKVLDYMAVMDVASLPQSVDGVGSFRYTTKICEYIAAKLPTMISQVPVGYDICEDWVWRLPGNKPWDCTYINAIAKLMESINQSDVIAKKQTIPTNIPDFDMHTQVARVTKFIQDKSMSLANPQ
jgi:glycosyltransferase involved in cell wall biosynthesis